MTSDAKTGSSAVEGVILQMLPSQYECLQKVLPDIKSEENAETPPPQDHDSKQCYLVYSPFPFRPRLWSCGYDG